MTETRLTRTQAGDVASDERGKVCQWLQENQPQEDSTWQEVINGAALDAVCFCGLYAIDLVSLRCHDIWVREWGERGVGILGLAVDGSSDAKARFAPAFWECHWIAKMRQMRYGYTIVSESNPLLFACHPEDTHGPLGKSAAQDYVRAALDNIGVSCNSRQLRGGLACALAEAGLSDEQIAKALGFETGEAVACWIRREVVEVEDKSITLPDVGFNPSTPVLASSPSPDGWLTATEAGLQMGRSSASVREMIKRGVFAENDFQKQTVCSSLKGRVTYRWLIAEAAVLDKPPPHPSSHLRAEVQALRDMADELLQNMDAAEQ